MGFACGFIHLLIMWIVWCTPPRWDARLEFILQNSTRHEVCDWSEVCCPNSFLHKIQTQCWYFASTSPLSQLGFGTHTNTFGERLSDVVRNMYICKIHHKMPSNVKLLKTPGWKLQSHHSQRKLSAGKCGAFFVNVWLKQNRRLRDRMETPS